MNAIQLRGPHRCDSAHLPADLVLLPGRCYRCRQPTAPIAGLWLEHDVLNGHDYGMAPEPGGWFLTYDDDTADIITSACPDELLAAHGVGPLHWRTTRPCPDGYLANTCPHCGTVLGNWPLHEALIEYRAEGGKLRDLPHIPSALHQKALTDL